MQSLASLKNQFLDYVEIEKGRSLKTRENYDRYISRFLGFVKIDNPALVTDALLREFRLWLNRQSNLPWKSLDAQGRPLKGRDNGETLSKKTQNYYLIALRAFFKYLAREGIPSLSPERIELAKVSERSLDLITSAELERLRNAPKGNDLKSLRDKAILELLFSTGLRVSELCSLTVDIDLSVDELSIRGKGGKVRVVFISDEAKKHVKAYISARKDMESALFVRIGIEKKSKLAGNAESPKKNTKKPEQTMEASQLNRHSIERIIRFYATKAGLSKRVTPHTMRHLFATDLLSNGADIRSVQALLGHSSIITTQIYTHVTDKHLRDIHKKFHGKKA
jgi:site-specific recombinase XerD